MTAPAKPVFISYTRRRGSKPAQALLDLLGPDVGFLDSNDIGSGDDFVETLLDAVLGAKVIVVFIDETYFEREYCFFEYEIATSPYRMLVEQKASPAQLQGALDHLVIARPDEFPPELVDRLDQPLRDRNWVPASDTAALCALVEERLATNSTLADRLGVLRPDADALRADLKDYALPRPRSLNGHPVFFGDPRPESLYDEFKGRRADIWRIHHELTTGRELASHSVILRGIGGVGKTTLASEYLFRFGPPHYPGGLFWVNAGVVTDDAVDAQLHGILRQLTPGVPTWQEFKAGGRDVAAELAAELRRPGIQPVLYVVENLPADRDRLPPLSRWCPAPDAVSLLVTTRISTNFRGPTEMDLDVLWPANARAMLTTGLDSDLLTTGEWDEITAWVGRLPLGLALLRGTLEYERPEELLERVRSHAASAATLVEAEGHVEAAAPFRGVEEAFKHSYENLPDDVRTGARLIAQLSPAAIPLALLKALGPEASGSRTRQLLPQRSFVTRSRDEGGVEIFARMHPVLADYLVTLSPDPDSERSSVCGALQSLLGPDDARNPARWPVLNALHPHGAHVFFRIAAGEGPVELHRSAVVLGLRLGALLRSRGLLGDADRLFQAVTALAERAWGVEHPQTVAVRAARAETLLADGHLDEAFRLYDDVLRVSRACADLGRSHPDTLAYEAQMATTLAAQGLPEGARRLLQRVVDAFATDPQQPGRRVLSYKQDLAVVLADMGQVAAASDLQAEVLREAVASGVEERFLLRGRANLAAMLAALGRLEEAEREQRRLVAVAPPVLGAGHPDVLEYQAQLARFLTEQGKVDEALALLVEGMAAAEASSSTDQAGADRRVAQLRRDLAAALVRMGRLDEARDHLQRSVTVLAAGRRDHSSDVTLAAWSLLVVLHRLGDGAAVAEVRGRYLDWLLDRESGPLTRAQQQVRAELAAFVGARAEAAKS